MIWVQDWWITSSNHPAQSHHCVNMTRKKKEKRKQMPKHFRYRWSEYKNNISGSVQKLSWNNLTMRMREMQIFAHIIVNFTSMCRCASENIEAWPSVIDTPTKFYSTLWPIIPPSPKKSFKREKNIISFSEFYLWWIMHGNAYNPILLYGNIFKLCNHLIFVQCAQCCTISNSLLEPLYPSPPIHGEPSTV